MAHSIYDILFLDIETVSIAPTFDEMPPRLRKQWEQKSAWLRNDEELSIDEFYFKRAGIYAEFGKIIVIGLGFLVKTEEGTVMRVKSISGHDEKEVLKEFEVLVSTYKLGYLALCAHNGREFDFPYLCRRMLLNGLPLPDVLDLADKKPWEVNHFDTMDMWKFGDRKSYTSLELLTAIFDIPSPKTDIDGSQVNAVYYQEQGLERIASYCKNDVVATVQLFLKLRGMEVIPEKNITIL